jgi:hypothetical protein
VIAPVARFQPKTPTRFVGPRRITTARGASRASSTCSLAFDADFATLHSSPAPAGRDIAQDDRQ